LSSVELVKLKATDSEGFFIMNHLEYSKAKSYEALEIFNLFKIAPWLIYTNYYKKEALFLGLLFLLIPNLNV
jgi:hypothetical protein